VAKIFSAQRNSHVSQLTTNAPSGRASNEQGVIDAANKRVCPTLKSQYSTGKSRAVICGKDVCHHRVRGVEEESEALRRCLTGGGGARFDGGRVRSRGAELAGEVIGRTEVVGS